MTFKPDEAPTKKPSSCNKRNVYKKKQRERERERGRKIETEREREREKIKKCLLEKSKL